MKNDYSYNNRSFGYILQKAIEDLIVNQEEYEKLNPENGWGTYYDLLEAIKEMRNCCEDNPDGIIDVC